MPGWVPEPGVLWPDAGSALPPWREVRREFPRHGLASVGSAVAEQLAHPDIARRIAPGAEVALAVGSRGVSQLPVIVATLVDALRAMGARPFIVPAMGSHGGATAEGQCEVLASLGVTAASVGAPIRAGMETVEVGQVLGGVPVHVDRTALTAAQAVIPVARVKPHTDFRGPVESGLLKMLALGLGNHRGAGELHGYPLERFSEIIAAAGRLVIEKARVPFGVAVVEDAHDEIALVEAVPAEAIPDREPALLECARAWLPRLPFDDADVLVVQEIGKNIAGTGMDPNVTGRFYVPTMVTDVHIGRVVVLDLSEATHGNAAGIGMADVTTRRAVGKIDWGRTYTNEITARLVQGARLPLVAGSDREALSVATGTVAGVRPENARLAWIRNTATLSRLLLSEPLWTEIDRQQGVRALGPARPIGFGADGSLEVPEPVGAPPTEGVGAR